MKSKPVHAESLLTVKDVCERFRLSKVFVYQHLGNLPHMRCGRTVRFDAHELTQYFKTQAAR